jgi:hypothetical protein
MAGQFTITEILQDGATVPGGAARFVWSADAPGPIASATTGQLGGVRAIPLRGWSMGTQVRHKRTDYPGGDEPTFQVLGPQSAEMVFDGAWDDRFNYAGYARATRRAFNDMVRRGNLVRIEFSGLAWVGLITEAEYPYAYDERIEYRFTFSPLAEEDAAPVRPVSNGNQPLSASALTDKLSADLDAIRDMDPGVTFSGSFLDTVNDALTSIEGAFTELDAAVQSRIVQPSQEARLTVLRVSQLFGQVASSAESILDELAAWKADAQLAWRTAESVLSFEGWRRMFCARLRLLSVRAHDASDEVERRADPEGQVYRPRQGEHLMSVSQRFYGTPHQWRGLMARNGLASPVMTGDELLVVPSAGATGV